MWEALLILSSISLFIGGVGSSIVGLWAVCEIKSCKISSEGACK